MSLHPQFDHFETVDEAKIIEAIERSHVLQTIAAIRAFGPEVEKEIASEIAEERADAIVINFRFLRFAHSATRAAAALANLKHPKTQTVLAALRADSHVFEVGLRDEMRRLGTTRDNSHFSHPGKRKFSSRPSRSKSKGAQ